MRPSIPSLRVYSRSKSDEKNAKILSRILEYQWERDRPFVEAIQMTIYKIKRLYGIELPTMVFYDVQRVYQEKMMDNITNSNQPMAMKSRTASTNPGNKMSTASTDKSWRPAKKKAVVAKKKVVAKGKKK